MQNGQKLFLMTLTIQEGDEIKGKDKRPVSDCRYEDYFR